MIDPNFMNSAESTHVNHDVPKILPIPLNLPPFPNLAIPPKTKQSYHKTPS